MEKTIRVFEAFAGYGSQRMALDNLDIKHEIVATSEVDEYAILSYGAIHGSNLDKELPESEEVIKEYLTKLNVPLTDKGKLKNLRGKRLRRLYNALEQSNGLGDISKINVNEVPDHDLFTYSFPCTDLSVAGKQAGFEKGSGTASSLLWECQRIITAKRPKYLLLENVKNLVGKRFKSGFEEWQEYLTSIGYTNYWEVLNAKDFGIPQNRERVFMVSILGEHEPYVFPKPIKLEKRLKDVLEDEVDEKYYLNNEKAEQLIATITEENNITKPTVVDATVNEPKTKEIMNAITARYDAGIQNYKSIGGAVIEPERILGIFDKENRTHQSGSVYNKDKIAPTLDTMQGGWRQPSIIDEPKIATSQGRVQKDMAQTPTTDDSKGVLEQYRIRKLTPLECFRLMDVKDEDFYKAQAVNSNSQLYKQAGNSIVVSVLEEIFRNMFN